VINNVTKDTTTTVTNQQDIQAIIDQAAKEYEMKI
jgi:hypothetical protein